MGAKGFRKALPALALLLLLSVVCILIYFTHMNRETLYISHESGIYSGSFDLAFRHFKKGTVFYTTNGHIPEPDTEGTYAYTGPIRLECKEETTTYSFQICCLYDDGTQSEVYRRDYILDPDGAGRFTTTYVVSIAGNEEELFGDEAGIFVRGNRFYEYMEEHPETNVLGDVVPANYHEDIEVPVHAAIFTKDGTQIIDQNCGVKIYGNATRQHNQKSFRLYARYEYDKVNEFSYPFFEDICTQNGKEPIANWQRLSFHNAGTDHDFGYIRSELVDDLARQSGFEDAMGAESVTVYINGKYQGVYWLQNTFDDRYFKEKYGDYNGEMAVCEGTLSVMDVNEAKTDTELQTCKDYNEFVEWIDGADLSDDTNWQRVCDTIDVENFAHYFAIEYYTGNLDWPQNNVKVYRYMCAEGEDYQEGTVFDGRYRFLLFDMDYSFGLFFLDMHGHNVSTQRLKGFMTTDSNATLFRAMMQREEFKDMFSGKVMYLMNEICTRDNVSEKMYNLNVMRYDELKYMIEETTILQGSIWEPWGVGLGGMSDTEAEWGEILTYVEQRPLYIIQELQNELQYGDAYSLSVFTGEGEVLINGMSVGEVYSGSWLEGIPLEVTCSLPVGKTVKGYLINGDYADGSVYRLTHIDGELSGAEIAIQPVIETVDVQSLTVSSYHISDSQDWVVLYNNGTVVLNLSEYALADSEETLSNATLPAMELQPGEKIKVYGKHYTGEMEEKSVQMNFAWNDEEQIYLYHETTGLQTY